LLKEAGQDVAKNKTFQPGSKGGSDELEYAKVYGRGDCGGSKKEGNDCRHPGKNKKDQGFKS
jgi:hypothetical protein